MGTMFWCWCTVIRSIARCGGLRWSGLRHFNRPRARARDLGGELRAVDSELHDSGEIEPAKWENVQIEHEHEDERTAAGERSCPIYEDTGKARL